MHKLRSITVGLGALALVAAASAQFDGPAPLAWRSMQPTSVPPGGSPVTNGDDIYQSIGGRIYCLDRSTGNKRWQFPQVEAIPGVFRTSPVLSNGTLIGVGDNKIVYAIDPATGNSKWSANLPTGALGSPVVAGNLVVVALSDNSLISFKVGDGSPGWSNPYKVFDGLTGTIAASGNNVVLFTGRQQMASLNTATQKLDWSQTFTQLAPNPSATVVGDTIYTNSGPYLIALNAGNGMARWQTATPLQLALSPVYSPTGILVTSQDGKLLIIDPVSHKIVTKTPIDLGSLPNVKPTSVGNGKFIVPTSNGAINLVDATTGDAQWSYILRPAADAVASTTTTSSGPGGKGGGGFGGFGGQGPGGQNSGNKTQEKITFIQAAAPAVLVGETLLVPARDGSIFAFDRNLGVDLTPPKVEMLFPNAGDQVSGQPPLVLYFRLTDEASGLNTKSLKVEVNGQPLDFTLNKDGTILVRFSQTGKNRPLADGRKEIIVTAADWMGNEIRKPFALTIDNALAPIVIPGSSTNGGKGGPNGPGGPGGGGIGGGGLGGG
ncbi:PQQ-like beta-propeller repeat protein [Fimbriimonas ginsengisoli]|uniref:Transmembrane serine/threonine protein kinase D n=1 Tax=Fimbriimonas ginsengisoli Gsoil 348 TaxID=661478 RepID=A0A068NLE1_FIMGI|nr:PQQ-like beta-propeller repeat protein [Fimbriimonas ginsengisoli]AIE84393.1 transmembrane serine/threonine protein kinase D [Fimbriimonas ginsengisoli Gsoil 348]